jgi:hypothetical protein
MKEYCISCVYFTPIEKEVGYCIMLGVGIHKTAIILDAYSTLKTTGIVENSELYSHLIVQSRFGCVCYKRMAML